MILLRAPSSTCLSSLVRHELQMDGSLPGSAIDSTYGIDSFFGFLDSLCLQPTVQVTSSPPTTTVQPPAAVAKAAPPPVGGGGRGLEGDQTRLCLGGVLGLSTLG